LKEKLKKFARGHMSEILTRNPRADEVHLLKSLWSSVFGNIGIDAFFCLFFKPEHCVVVEHSASLAAMGYLIPSGEINAITDGTGKKQPVKCAMIYSVGTLPEYRGLGLGTIIVNNLIGLAGDLGYDAVVLCPSEDGLFEYYGKRTKLLEWFYISESIFTKPPAGKPAVLPTEVSITDYLAVRDKLLAEVVHIKQDEKLFRYQLDLCSEYGGGLFRIGDSYAVVERQINGIVWVKELLMSGKNFAGYHNPFPDNDYKDFLTSIAHMFPADGYLIRTPAKHGAGRRFGMLNFCGSFIEIPVKNDISPWFGMAFD
jgi:GNAT superfamily N-acetyltransferase